MHQVETLAVLLSVVGIFGVLAERFKVPLPMMLIFAGILLSLIPFAPSIELDPEIIFFIVLPPLLYIESFQTPWKKFKDVGDLISAQAVGLVIATIFGVAAALKFVIPEIPWAIALAFGAIVSPTDAVSVAAVAKGATIPSRTMNIIKGESLVNDATGLVGYQCAVAAAVTGAFSLLSAGQSFLYIAFGGIAVGLILGWLLKKIRTDLSHRPSEIIASLLSPFLVYLAAEHLKVSGILAVVTSGLLLGIHGPRMLTSPARVQAKANWDSITYILNGFTFLLIGLEVKPILQRVLTHSPLQLLLSTVIVLVSLFLIRLSWTFVMHLFRKGFRLPTPDFKHILLFSWCGMRGVVSLAAALSLPLTLSNNQPFPYRDLLIFLTIVVIAFSLFIQGGTLPALIKLLGITPAEDNKDESERMTRLKMNREAIRAIDEAATRHGIDRTDPIFQQVVNGYVVAATTNMSTRDTAESELYTKLETIASASQRKLLLNLRETDDIDEELFQQLQHELDLVDMHMKVLVQNDI